MMDFLYTFDIYYLALVLPMVVISLICSFAVQSTFKKYSKVPTKRRVTGAQAAAKVAQAAGADTVRVEATPGSLSDHYDPRSNVIRLSQPVYGQTSVSAVAVAAHEAGHAGQYASGYAPAAFRAAIVGVTNFGSALSVPLVLLGLALGYDILINIGILLFSLVFFFQVVTLPVEFNASRRALRSLDDINLLDDGELKMAKKVLRAAAMTYVAAMALSLAQLLRLMALSKRRR
jgi:Zn-dependent membrane protease YugP